MELICLRVKNLAHPDILNMHTVQLSTSINPEGCCGSSQVGLRQVGEGLTSFPPAPGTMLQQLHQKAGQVVSTEHSVQGTQGKARGRGEKGVSRSYRPSLPALYCPPQALEGCPPVHAVGDVAKHREGLQ